MEEYLPSYSGLKRYCWMPEGLLGNIKDYNIFIQARGAAGSSAYHQSDARLLR
jgi:hypothetical protein